MPDDRDDGLDREELRAALLDLLRLSALWESGALARGLAETRRANERLLNVIVEAIREHQRIVPVARAGKHLVRRVDLQLARVHECVAESTDELTEFEASSRVAPRQRRHGAPAPRSVEE